MCPFIDGSVLTYNYIFLLCAMQSSALSTFAKRSESGVRMCSFVELGLIVFVYFIWFFCCVVSNLVNYMFIFIYLDTLRTIPNSLRSRPQPFIELLNF